MTEALHDSTSWVEGLNYFKGTHVERLLLAQKAMEAYGEQLAVDGLESVFYCDFCQGVSDNHEDDCPYIAWGKLEASSA